EGDVTVGKPAHERPDDLHRRVTGVLDTEHDLVLGIVLTAEGLEVRRQLAPGTLEGLQDGDRRGVSGRETTRAPEEAPRGHDLQELVEAGDRGAREHERDHGDHVSSPWG